MKTLIDFDTEDSPRSRVNIYFFAETYETSFYYKVLTHGVNLRLSSEALTPSIFLLAMKYGGGQINLPFPISIDFKRSFDMIVSIFLKWFPGQFSYVSINSKVSNTVVPSLLTEHSN